jgi:uncharacterized membrane protein
MTPCSCRNCEINLRLRIGRRVLEGNTYEHGNYWQISETKCGRIYTEEEELEEKYEAKIINVE